MAGPVAGPVGGGPVAGGRQTKMYNVYYGSYPSILNGACKARKARTGGQHLIGYGYLDRGS